MFAEDPDDPVNSIEFTFLHRKHDGFWDWPRKPDMKQVSSKFVFYGPCLPSAPTKKGFQFPDEEAASKQYKLYKKNIHCLRRWLLLHNVYNVLCLVSRFQIPSIYNSFYIVYMCIQYVHSRVDYICTVYKYILYMYIQFNIYSQIIIIYSMTSQTWFRFFHLQCQSVSPSVRLF